MDYRTERQPCVVCGWTTYTHCSKCNVAVCDDTPCKTRHYYSKEDPREDN